MRTHLVAVALLAALVPAAAQTAFPYAIETFGAFRKVILEGDFTPKVLLGAVIVLFIWHRFVAPRAIPDAGAGPR